MTYKKHRSWFKKFADAFEGIWLGIKGQNSFLIHIPAATIAIILGFVFQIAQTEWLAVILCIGFVLSAELFNSAIEELAKSVTHEHSEHIRIALNVSSAAVLIAAITSVSCGFVVFGEHFFSFLIK